MRILAIETSCDDSSVAILEKIDQAHVQIHAHVTQSQIELHRPYGGVFPSMAKRAHAENLVPVLLQALHEAGLASSKCLADWNEALMQDLLQREPDLLEAMQKKLSSSPFPEFDYITVTVGPGLEPSLWVGINFAKALSHLWNVPVIPVNHMEGHIYSALIADYDANNRTLAGEVLTLVDPGDALALLISGGHTEIVQLGAGGKRRRLGVTRDDAVGEAFDKVARLMDLPYPGGPEISRLAEAIRDGVGDGKAIAHARVSLPRPMIGSDDLDFSFSGLKTAVRRLVEQQDKDISDEFKQDLALEFENAVTEVLLAKVSRALDEYPSTKFAIAGGVSANRYIRAKFAELCTERQIDFFMPPLAITGDNALMIGLAAYEHVADAVQTGGLDTIVASGRLNF